jgi:hypothetical protein
MKDEQIIPDDEHRQMEIVLFIWVALSEKRHYNFWYSPTRLLVAKAML